MSKQWVLAGGGAFAREVVGWMRMDGAAAFRGYVDEKEDGALTAYGLPWLGRPAAFQADPGDQLLLVIGDPGFKKKVVGEMSAWLPQFASFVHSSALIHPTAKLGAGCVICPRSVVSADAEVGDFVHVNLMSTVGHDVRLGSYSTLSAHVDLTGRVGVGEGVFFGSGARVLPGVQLGAQCRVGAGATVVRNLAAGVTVYTAAAKRLS